MIKLTSLCKRILYSFARKFNLINSNYFRIDGGLGSQIICYLIYAQAYKKNKFIFFDISFFLKRPDDLVFSTNTYRSWSLDNFGISLESLIVQPNLSFFDRLKLKPDDIYYGHQFEKFMINYNYDLAVLFPNFGWEKTLLSKYLIQEGDYSVIHIRKGDFILQASYLVNDLSYIKLLRSLNIIISNNVFIVSDEYLGASLEQQIKDVLTNSKVYFEYSATEIVTHGLMRNAKILVTSNSMFSLSAAILRDKSLLTITPKIFFGNSFETYNKGINSLSDWNII
jgi:hypothetical protein